MARVLITGGGGFLGGALLRAAPAGWESHATLRRTAPEGGVAHAVELADRGAVRALWAFLEPELVIHTAYSTESPERDIRDATRNVAEATREVGAALVHMSTDMLFDGEHGPYSEDDPPSPVLDYGRWKAEAEDHVRETVPGAAIVRSSLLTSFTPLDPRSAWIASGLRGEQRVTLFVDELRTPIQVDDLAAQIWEIARLAPGERAGVWHLAGPESMSRYALGLLVAAHLGLSPAPLGRALSEECPSRRPRDLRLRTDRADAALRTRARALSALVGEGG